VSPSRGAPPAPTPRTAGPMPRETALLELCEDYTQGGLWGIGLNLELSPPHHVLHVDDLVRASARACWPAPRLPRRPACPRARAFALWPRSHTLPLRPWPLFRLTPTGEAAITS